jgi:hypothetical protein
MVPGVVRSDCGEDFVTEVGRAPVGPVEASDLLILVHAQAAGAIEGQT